MSQSSLHDQGNQARRTSHVSGEARQRQARREQKLTQRLPMAQQTMAEPRDVHLMRRAYSTARPLYQQMLSDTQVSENRSASKKFAAAARALSHGAGEVMRKRARVASVLLATSQREKNRLAFIDFLKDELNSNVPDSAEELGESLEEQVNHIFSCLMQIQVLDYKALRELMQDAVSDDSEGDSKAVQELRSRLQQAEKEKQAAGADNLMPGTSPLPQTSRALNNLISEVLEALQSLKKQMGYQKQFDAVAVSEVIRERRTSIRAERGSLLVLPKKSSVAFEIVEEDEDEEKPAEKPKYLLDLASAHQGKVQLLRQRSTFAEPSHSGQRALRKAKTGLTSLDQDEGQGLGFKRKKGFKKTGTTSGLYMPALLKTRLRKSSEDADEADDLVTSGEEPPEPVDELQSESGTFQETSAHKKYQEAPDLEVSEDGLEQASEEEEKQHEEQEQEDQEDDEEEEEEEEEEFEEDVPVGSDHWMMLQDLLADSDSDDGEGLLDGKVAYQTPHRPSVYAPRTHHDVEELRQRLTQPLVVTLPKMGVLGIGVWEWGPPGVGLGASGSSKGLLPMPLSARERQPRDFNTALPDIQQYGRGFDTSLHLGQFASTSSLASRTGLGGSQKSKHTNAWVTTPRDTSQHLSPSASTSSLDSNPGLLRGSRKSKYTSPRITTPRVARLPGLQ
mmetsp:Transcript_96308/g.171103  ORF Transcript_96308/g.171103 Transcript_96308/m.171103 type:complete len:676 (+) Transcript_96308:62-2089(+)